MINEMSLNENMKIAIRVRSPNSGLTKSAQPVVQNTVRVTDVKSLIFDPTETKEQFYFQGRKHNCRSFSLKENKNVLFEFDDVFGVEAQNKDIFERLMKPVVHSLMDGLDWSALIYGATGAGKTHTMFGNEKERGIAYLTMEYIFFQLNKRLPKDSNYEIRVSLVEIYNEHLMNLLTKSRPLTVLENANGDVVIVGLSTKKVINLDDIQKLLAFGNRNRTKHQVNATSHSSQSHVVLQVHIDMPHKSKNSVKLTMTESGGSERNTVFGGCRERVPKGLDIHRSIFTLKNCIFRLADGCKDIPFGDSLLTRLLKRSFNDGRTVMLFVVSPSPTNYDDTYNTLTYATRARKIGKMNNRKMLSSLENTSRGDQPNVDCNLLKRKSIFTTVKAPQTNISKANATKENIPATVPDNQMKQKTVAQKKNGVKHVNAIELTELTRWYYEIGAVYDAFKTAVEGCCTSISRQILLGLRNNCKDEVEKCLAMLVSDQNRNTVIRIKSLLQEIIKQSYVSLEKISYWTSRLQICQQQVMNLHQKVKESKFCIQLEPYICVKENELIAIKSQHESLHRIKCNGVYVLQTEIYGYLLLCANITKSQPMQDYYSQIITVNGGSHATGVSEFSKIQLPLYKYFLAGSNSKDNSLKESSKGRSRIPIGAQRNN